MVRPRPRRVLRALAPSLVDWQNVRRGPGREPVPFDRDGSVWNANYQQGIPANYILDKQGKVRLLQMGAFPNEDAMMAALEAVRRLDEQ